MLTDNQFLKVRVIKGKLWFILYISNINYQTTYKFGILANDFMMIKDKYKPMYLGMVLHYLQKKVNV